MNTQKGFGIGAVIGIIALVAIVGGGFYALNQEEVVEDDAMMMESKDDSVMEKDDAMMTNDDSMMEEDKEGDVMMEAEGEMMMEKGAGTYEDYSAEKVASAEGDVVLFFHASWCPTCRALNSNIEANLGAIPDGVTILKTDYDSETALKQKYGVTYQHTLVQVDNDGNMITKWSGGNTLASLIAKIQ